MNNVRDNISPATDSVSKEKRGLKIALDPIRPAAPIITWNTASAITDLDPQTIKEACPACLNPIYECICGG